METQSAIIISAGITSFITIGGWIYNNYRARKHEIDKKRLDYRIKTLHTLVHMSSYMINIQKPINYEDDLEFINKMDSLSLNIQLYGDNEEMELVKKCNDAINNRDIITTKEYSTKIFLLIIPKIREELKLQKIK